MCRSVHNLLRNNDSTADRSVLVESFFFSRRPVVRNGSNLGIEGSGGIAPFKNIHLSSPVVPIQFNARHESIGVGVLHNTSGEVRRSPQFGGLPFLPRQVGDVEQLRSVLPAATATATAYACRIILCGIMCYARVACGNSTQSLTP